MHRLIKEYGRVIIAVIAVSAVMLFIGMILSSDKSIATIFEKNKASSSVYDDYYNVIGDTIENDTVPYFKIVDENGLSLEEPDNQIDFTIEDNAFTWSDAFKNIHIFYHGNDITNASSIDGQDVNLTVIAYKYTPKIEKDEDDINGHLVMKEANATDEYGRLLKDEAGKNIKVQIPEYTIEKGILTKINYIDITDDNQQIQLVYRVQIGNYKAECKAIYVKNQKTDTVKQTTGLTKVVFEPL